MRIPCPQVFRANGKKLAFVAILVLATVLYGWRLWSADWGNTYYTAAIKAMSHDWKAFLFGSFDPDNVVTVDKPPASLWPQVFSVWIFGYHPWSIMLPEAVEGVLTVFFLHRAVRAWAGENVALVAALLLAFVPITAASVRDNNTDPMLVLFVVAAACTLARAVVPGVAPKSATKWLLLCAFLLGWGFLSKMMAAWMPVPAFACAYLAGARVSLGRRVVDLLGAGAVLVVSSLWWVALHDFWPGGAVPYMGSSSNGSTMDLVLGYNGLGRILGQGSPGTGTVSGGSGSLTRMFGRDWGGQISWLLPLSLLILVAVGVAAMRRWRARLPPRHVHRAGWLLWGGWLLVVGLLLSLGEGIAHSYYTVLIAPPIAAVCAAGLAQLRRVPFLLPAGIVLTAVWAWVLISRDPAWHGWLRYAVAVLAVLAVVLLVARTPRAGVVLGLVAIVLAPAVWSADVAFASSPGSGGGSPAAGPRTRGYPGPQRRSATMVARRTGGFGGNGKLTAAERRILAYVTANDGGAKIQLAIEGGARIAGDFLVATDANVIGMGGFSGRDAVPSPTQLTRWVSAGELKFVLADAGGRGVRGGSAVVSRARWISQHCTVVPPAGYGVKAPAPGQTLYACHA